MRAGHRRKAAGPVRVPPAPLRTDCAHAPWGGDALRTRAGWPGVRVAGGRRTSGSAWALPRVRGRPVLGKGCSSWIEVGLPASGSVRLPPRPAARHPRAGPLAAAAAAEGKSWGRIGARNR